MAVVSIRGAGAAYYKDGPAQRQSTASPQASAKAGASTATTGSKMETSKQNQAASGARSSSGPKASQPPIPPANSTPKGDTFQKNSSNGPQLVTYTSNGTLRGIGSVGGSTSAQTSALTVTTKGNRSQPNPSNESNVSQAKGWATSGLRTGTSSLPAWEHFELGIAKRLLW